jgi:hypothetical protein
VQDDLQTKINGALGELADASAMLHDDKEHSRKIDELLESIIKKQNDIASKQGAWAEVHGDVSQSMPLAVSGTVHDTATTRCALPAPPLCTDPCALLLHPRASPLCAAASSHASIAAQLSPPLPPRRMARSMQHT